uniref:hypothetical protein n=1 Tax=Escherichia coli TaxID=562 RepID=UPI002E78A9AC
ISGEAARLLGCSVAEIESDRLHCAKRLVQRYGGVAVLIALEEAGRYAAEDADVTLQLHLKMWPDLQKHKG